MLTRLHSSRRSAAALSSVLLFSATLPSTAQERASAIPYVRVHGEATVAVQPDRAQLDIGIISQGPSAKAVTDLNAKQSAAVVEQLHSILPSVSAKTVNFSVNPNYRYAKDGGTPEIVGYTASNTVRLKVDDLALVQRVIEVATKAGANNVNRLDFMLRDEVKARAEALGQAATQAHAGAEALATSLKLKLGNVISVEEGQPVIITSVRQAEIANPKLASGATPLDVGNIEIHASINVTFALLR